MRWLKWFGDGEIWIMMELKVLLDAGFWERRAMEALPITVLMLIVVGIAAACGYIGGKIRQRKGKKPKDEQKE